MAERIPSAVVTNAIRITRHLSLVFKMHDIDKAMPLKFPRNLESNTLGVFWVLARLLFASHHRNSLPNRRINSVD